MYGLGKEVRISLAVVPNSNGMKMVEKQTAHDDSPDTRTRDTL